MEETPILNNRTRTILRQDIWPHAFAYGTGCLAANIWYSKIDGTIYSLGSRNPNVSEQANQERLERMLEGKDPADMEEDCMTVKVDRFGLLPEEIPDTYLNGEITHEVCGSESVYAK